MVLRFQLWVARRITVALAKIGYARRRSAGRERQPIRALTVLSLRFLWGSWPWDQTRSQQTRSEFK